MYFNKDDYTVETLTLEDRTIHFRAYRNVIYVEHPVNEQFHKMNIFVPEIYYDKACEGLHKVPVFMPTGVGGYMPSDALEPGYERFGPKRINAVFAALEHGYVVASPAIRGRVLKDCHGKYYGKAPACIVDYKAAVRFLRYFQEVIPGDMSKIITNGTSAGGALSALMGTTGNHEDYEPYLQALGAAPASDHIFAASCYCPITNLDHGDMAYEWQFGGVNEYHRFHMNMDEGGRPSFSPEDGIMTDTQIRVSAEEKALFPAYVNSLGLRDENRTLLTLDSAGEGSFKDYVKSIIMDSARTAMDAGEDVSDKAWLTIEDGRIKDMDFFGYVSDITRMKTAPAFDDLSMTSPENDLFGSETVNCRHFTNYSSENTVVSGTMAPTQVIRMMNPMEYIHDDSAEKAKYFRIRHGECDRDTSLAISAILSIKLRENGCHVDYRSPWGIPHAGDYDLEELFAWIDKICDGK